MGQANGSKPERVLVLMQGIRAEEAYQARLDKILRDSTLAYNKTRRAQQQGKAAVREGMGLRQRVSWQGSCCPRLCRHGSLGVLL
jgi:hypothetical protein